MTHICSKCAYFLVKQGGKEPYLCSIKADPHVWPWKTGCQHFKPPVLMWDPKEHVPKRKE